MLNNGVSLLKSHGMRIFPGYLSLPEDGIGRNSIRIDLYNWQNHTAQQPNIHQF
jgi:hypothetical protein